MNNLMTIILWSACSLGNIDEIKVGDLVVMRYTSSLTDESRIVDDGKTFRIYTVDQIRDDSANLSFGNLSGWTDIRNLVLFERSIEFYTREIAFFETAQAYCSRGLIRKHRGEFGLAIDDFDKALQLDKSNISYINNKAFTLLDAKDWNSAIFEFKRSLIINSNNPEAFHGMGLVMFHTGNIDKALDDYTQAIKLKKDFGNALVDRGVAWATKGELTKARDDTNEALRISGLSASSASSAFCTLGVINAIESNLAISIDFTKKAIDINPKNYVAHRNLASLLLISNKIKDSISLYEKSIFLNKNYVEAYTELAWLLATCQQTEFRDGPRSVKLAKIACELTSWREWNSLDSLAAGFAECGDFDKAIEYEIKAISLSNEQTIDLLNKRLELYRKKIPFRE
jgi:tetratricopeptide (TPR) repeat protein